MVQGNERCDAGAKGGWSVFILWERTASRREGDVPVMYR